MQHRRKYLQLVGSGIVAALAGCSGSGSGPDTSTAGTGTPADGTPDGTGTPTVTPAATVTATPEDGGTTLPSDNQGTQAAVDEFHAANGERDDGFGTSVEVSADGSTAVVSAPEDDIQNSEATGAVYVFGNDGGSWSQLQRLTADDGATDDRFGTAVAVDASGTTALVGRPDDSGVVSERNSEYERDSVGSAYVFTRDGDSWTQAAKLRAQEKNGYADFGVSVALSDDGTRALVGAPGTETGDYGLDSVGAAQIFERDNGSWTQQARLTADDGDDEDEFGNSVALSADGTTALVGAVNDADPNGATDESYRPGAGAAYVFSGDGGSWSQAAKLAAADGDGGDNFGNAVALADDGATALLGAMRDEDPNGTNSGAAYVFTRTGNSWQQQAKLAPEDGGPANRNGRYLSLSGDGTTAVLSNAIGSVPVYVFTRTGDGWTETLKLSPSEQVQLDDFGSAVSLTRDGSTALVGARNGEAPDGDQAGVAYAFEL